MKLSILIPSLKSRYEKYFSLYQELRKQIMDLPIEIISDIDNGEKTIGEKRTQLIRRSKGEYICFIDDDDMISADYIEQILSAIESSPDVVTFDGFLNNIKFSLKSGQKWETKDGVYLRGANHLCPIKRSIVKDYEFPRSNYEEDKSYEKFIQEQIKTEIHIYKPLYIYNYVEEKEYDKYRNDDAPETTNKIMIAVPNMGSIHPELVETILKWIYELGTDIIAVYMPRNATPVERARNAVVDTFMGSECSHLFFIDADTLPPLNALTTLYNMDNDIATGMTPIPSRVQDMKFVPNVKKKDGQIDWKLPAQEIDRCGMSCCMIKREVFEKLKKPYFKTVLDPYCRDILKGEDIYFCDKAKEAGFSIKLANTVICRHSKTIEF